MSLPAAAAVAVLVLAWDETTPAVRALVEATEAVEPILDSVVVLVPAGPDESEELTPEEFLPLDPLPELLDAAPPLLPSEEPVVASEQPAAEVVATLKLPILAAAALPVPNNTPQPTESSMPTVLPATLGAPTSLVPASTTLASGAVRVLRLSSFSLPELAVKTAQLLPLPIWRGSLATPTAPYVGSTEDSVRELPVPANQLATGQASSSQNSADSVGLLPLSSAAPLATPALTASPTNEAVAPISSTHLPAETLALAVDAEPDLGSKILADDLDLPVAAAVEEPLATEFVPAHADWSEALASLREPAPLEETIALAGPESEAAYYADTVAAAPNNAPPTPLAIRPASSQFAAPNLNFQVIQYARFAVPMALAEVPFDAIYAPAWPTWLAAQELRQRTGQPLVLHVATLAAGPDESVETATGWQAELQRQTLHRADLILTETLELAYRLRHELGLSAYLVRAVSAADSAAIAQALRTARPRPTVNLG